MTKKLSYSRKRTGRKKSYRKNYKRKNYKRKNYKRKTKIKYTKRRTRRCSARGGAGHGAETQEEARLRLIREMMAFEEADAEVREMMALEEAQMEAAPAAETQEEAQARLVREMRALLEEAHDVRELPSLLPQTPQEEAQARLIRAMWRAANGDVYERSGNAAGAAAAEEAVDLDAGPPAAAAAPAAAMAGPAAAEVPDGVRHRCPSPPRPRRARRRTTEDTDRRSLFAEFGDAPVAEVPAAVAAAPAAGADGSGLSETDRAREVRRQLGLPPDATDEQVREAGDVKICGLCMDGYEDGELVLRHRHAFPTDPPGQDRDGTLTNGCGFTVHEQCYNRFRDNTPPVCSQCLNAVCYGGQCPWAVYAGVSEADGGAPDHCPHAPDHCPTIEHPGHDICEEAHLINATKCPGCRAILEGVRWPSRRADGTTDENFYG